MNNQITWEDYKPLLSKHYYTKVSLLDPRLDHLPSNNHSLMMLLPKPPSWRLSLARPFESRAQQLSASLQTGNNLCVKWLQDFPSLRSPELMTTPPPRSTKPHPLERSQCLKAPSQLSFTKPSGGLHHTTFGQGGAGSIPFCFRDDHSSA